MRARRGGLCAGCACAPPPGCARPRHLLTPPLHPSPPQPAVRGVLGVCRDGCDRVDAQDQEHNDHRPLRAANGRLRERRPGLLFNGLLHRARRGRIHLCRHAERHHRECVPLQVRARQWGRDACAGTAACRARRMWTRLDALPPPHAHPSPCTPPPSSPLPRLCRQAVGTCSTAKLAATTPQQVVSTQPAPGFIYPDYNSRTALMTAVASRPTVTYFNSESDDLAPIGAASAPPLFARRAAPRAGGVHAHTPEPPT